MSHINISVLLMDLNRNPEALTHCDKALEILDPLVRQRSPAIPVYRHGLALAHNNRGEVLRKLNRMEEAVGAFKKALAIEDKLVAEFESVVPYRQSLGMSYTNIGELLTIMGRYDQAGDAYGKSLPIRKKLAEDYPANQAYAVELGGTYGGMGTLLLVQGQPDTALDWYDKALAKLEPVLEKDRRLPLARRFACLVYHNRAVALDNLARLAESLKAWDQALDVADRQQSEVIRQLRAAAQARLDGSKRPPISTEIGKLVEGNLTRDDPPDLSFVTQKSHCKVHAVSLEAGQPYLIDLKGDFDTFLRIEDSQKKPLLSNDDLGPGDLNSRIVFIPPQKGTYRIVVTSYKAGDTGSYTLYIQKAVKVGKPAVVEEKLDATDRKSAGRPFKTYTLNMAGGSPYTVELESQAFDVFVGVADAAGKKALASNDGVAPGNRRLARIDFTPKDDGIFSIVVTTKGQTTTGPFRLTVQRYEVEKEKK
jgi:tetratricopeptide (TPR) repeat protein